MVIKKHITISILAVIALVIIFSAAYFKTIEAKFIFNQESHFIPPEAFIEYIEDKGLLVKYNYFDILLNKEICIKKISFSNTIYDKDGPVRSGLLCDVWTWDEKTSLSLVSDGGEIEDITSYIVGQ